MVGDFPEALNFNQLFLNSTSSSGTNCWFSLFIGMYACVCGGQGAFCGHSSWLDAYKGCFTHVTKGREKNKMIEDLLWSLLAVWRPWPREVHVTCYKP